MQSRDKAAAVSLAAAGCAVAETDDVGAGLAQAEGKGQPLCMVGERDEPRFPVAIVAHEDDQLATGCEDASAILDEGGVAGQEQASMFLRQRWFIALPYSMVTHNTNIGLWTPRPLKIPVAPRMRHSTKASKPLKG